MKKLLARVAESYGALISVTGYKKYEQPEPIVNIVYDMYVLVFDHGTLAITADPEDDSIVARENSFDFPISTSLNDRPFWADLLGLEAGLVWAMKNHRGYRDGIQIEFAKPNEYPTIQYISEGAIVSAPRVVSLRRG
jgi:hypothetical protein